MAIGWQEFRPEEKRWIMTLKNRTTFLLTQASLWEKEYGSEDERSAVYRRCEKEGIGISVMKPFSGGQLLDAKQSPFGKALTQYQCIRYCLDKPGILTVLPGAQSVQEVFYRRGNIIHHNILIHSARDYTR